LVDYELFSRGDLEGLSKFYHPGCSIKVNGTHALSGEYNGFASFASNFLAKLNTVWLGFSIEIEKVVSNKTDVCVFVKTTADNLSTRSIHHFVVENGLEVEVNMYDDNQAMSASIQNA
jgi:ketosteroid isomerase-like protein